MHLTETIFHIYWMLLRNYLFSRHFGRVYLSLPPWALEPSISLMSLCLISDFLGNSPTEELRPFHNKFLSLSLLLTVTFSFSSPSPFHSCCLTSNICILEGYTVGRGQASSPTSFTPRCPAGCGVQDKGNLWLLEVLIVEAEGRPEGGLMDGNHYGYWASLGLGQRGPTENQTR